jgi:hypothetical protein
MILLVFKKYKKKIKIYKKEEVEGQSLGTKQYFAYK